MINPTTVGQRVALLRKKQNLTQRQLAKRADISPTFVSDIENDKRNVSSSVLLQIADALGASLDYLMRGETKQQDESPSEPRSIPPELEAAAEEEGWSYSDTVALLDAKRMVRARRGGRETGKAVEDLKREDWIRLHDSLMDR
jgi:transcriptional regulator with XRE-family HTH domain